MPFPGLGLANSFLNLGPSAQLTQGATPQDPEQLQTLIDAAQRAREAAQAESTSASTDYQTALNAPVEQVNPAASGLGLGLANLAETLGSKGAFQRQEASVRQKNAQFQVDRKANLERLRQTYESAAKRAEHEGDHEAELKARAAIHKLDKEATKEAADTAQQFQEAQQKRQFAQQDKLQNQRLSAESAAAEKKAKGGLEDIQGIAKDAIVTTDSIDSKGNPLKYLDLTNATDKDTKRAFLETAHQLGIPAISKDDANRLKEIQTARSNTMAALQTLDKAGLPEGWWQRAVQYPNIKMSEALQTNKNRAAFRSWYSDAINVLRANQGGNGLRMNEVEIKIARDALPKLTDTWEVAQKKFEIINNMFASREFPLIVKNWGESRDYIARQSRRQLQLLEKSGAETSTTPTAGEEHWDVDANGNPVRVK